MKVVIYLSLFLGCIFTAESQNIKLDTFPSNKPDTFWLKSNNPCLIIQQEDNYLLVIDTCKSKNKFIRPRKKNKKQ